MTTPQIVDVNITIKERINKLGRKKYIASTGPYEGNEKDTPNLAVISLMYRCKLTFEKKKP